jgi:hypothetical protein
MTEDGLRRALTPEQYFILCNGQPIANVKELAEVFEHLNHGVFTFHTANGRNDFANWIRGAFNDKELATRVQGANTPQELSQTIYQYLADRYFNGD